MKAVYAYPVTAHRHNTTGHRLPSTVITLFVGDFHRATGFVTLVLRSQPAVIQSVAAALRHQSSSVVALLRRDHRSFSPHRLLWFDSVRLII
ncbi:hypothetical protein Hdeb2414_s0595g00921631 [Helianthus debilis subsp. tardiflorus]